MIWIVSGVGLAVLALVITIAVVRRGRGRPDEGAIEDVDPLFSTGIVLAGAGVALATTLGPFMYAVMIVGLIVMAMGANRTRHHRH